MTDVWFTLNRIERDDGPYWWFVANDEGAHGYLLDEETLYHLKTVVGVA